MILCFDIGNTDIDVGVFENDVHVMDFNIPYEKEQSCWTYLGGILKALKRHNIKPEDVEGSILCSVVSNTTYSVYEAMEIAFTHKPVMFENDELTGITIKTDNPQEVGLDIIAGCMTVKEKHSLPAIVIDMGTATTVTAMDKDGAILGVSILTGVMTNLRALHTSTGLPTDESLTPPGKVIGTNTPDSIASGIVYGSAYTMEGMVKAFEKEIGEKCHVYATGGISKVIMPLCDCDCAINDDLLLEGMYIYYKRARG
ncbi:MAG: type III pantothenate kinase [Oscillospiraceae bacterium]|nr:type III pantothenate kinase [Oscillospiraceae bacterium]